MRKNAVHVPNVPPSLRRNRFWPLLAVSGLCLLLAACPSEAPDQKSVISKPDAVGAETPGGDLSLLLPVAFGALPGWDEDTMAEALPALKRSCGRLTRQPAERPIGPDGLAGTVGDWAAPCQALSGLAAGDDGQVRATIEAWFQPFLVSNGTDTSGIFTGYFESELKGDWLPTSPDAVPLYRPPPDLIAVDLGRFRADLRGKRIVGRLNGSELVPYHDRASIDQGVLSEKGLELFWINDPVDAFFLHIQGSGRVELPNGERKRVGYAASNGLPFFAIGAYMLDEGLISRKEASAQAIQAWLREHPEEARQVMQRNPRYIFFQEVEGEGPIGAQGVPLTAGRSLAVDPDFLPLGAPVYLDTTWPASDRPLQRLMVAQDTGSAIKGAIRGDFFWGTGDAALAEAGRMKQKGSYYLLLPKAVAERRDLSS